MNGLPDFCGVWEPYRLQVLAEKAERLDARITKAMTGAPAPQSGRRPTRGGRRTSGPRIIAVPAGSPPPPGCSRERHPDAPGAAGAHDATMMTEGEVVRLLGRKRFRRLLKGGWLSPCRKGYDVPHYPRSYVKQRLDEDRRLFPDEDDDESGSDARAEIIDRYEEDDDGSPDGADTWDDEGEPSPEDVGLLARKLDAMVSALTEAGLLPDDWSDRGKAVRHPWRQQDDGADE